MKTRWSILSVVAGFAVFFSLCAGSLSLAAEPKARASKTSCVPCHPDLSRLVPKGHPATKGNDIGACLGCHKPDASGKTEAKGFSSAIHRGHVGPDSKADCLICHTWTPGKRFSIAGQKSSFGSPTKEDLPEMKKAFASWKGSGYTDSLHGKANVMCGGCHGATVAKEGDTVENSRCLACHGPMEKLAEASAPKDFPDRNPHKSHLGAIDCTVCHKGHAESKTYCLQCHKAFEMKRIPGATGSR